MLDPVLLQLSFLTKDPPKLYLLTLVSSFCWFPEDYLLCICSTLGSSEWFFRKHPGGSFWHKPWVPWFFSLQACWLRTYLALPWSYWVLLWVRYVPAMCGWFWHSSRISLQSFHRFSGTSQDSYRTAYFNSWVFPATSQLALRLSVLGSLINRLIMRMYIRLQNHTYNNHNIPALFLNVYSNFIINKWFFWSFYF